MKFLPIGDDDSAPKRGRGMGEGGEEFVVHPRGDAVSLSYRWRQAQRVGVLSGPLWTLRERDESWEVGELLYLGLAYSRS